jgi:uncharacterized protein (DUF1015 family)
MAIIAPFKGLSYNFGTFPNIPELLAPPYDVISEEEQEKYYQINPYNVIRLTLGKRKTGDSDWDNRYTRSAELWARWQSEEVIVPTKSPSMYVTSQTYDLGDAGGPRTRWGLIALVRIEEKGSGVILPHEKTFSAHRDDRLKLMRASNAQFSQVFALYEDSENAVFEALKGPIHISPRVSFQLHDGTSHQMWTVQDPSIFVQVASAMRKKSIIIADGHHRYETARDYRNVMRARYGHRPPNRAYEYAMMYLTNMNDVGLTILPSHRMIKRCQSFKLESFLETLRQWFEITTLPPSDSNLSPRHLMLKKALEERGDVTSAIGFHHHGDHTNYILSLKQGARDEMGEDLHDSLKELDVLVLSRLIFQKALGFNEEDMDDEEIFHYQSDMEKALSRVDAGDYQMTFLVNPTKMEHIQNVTANALIMPRKSTFFYPKVITGLVFNRVDPHEIIQVPQIEP